MEEELRQDEEEPSASASHLSVPPAPPEITPPPAITSSLGALHPVLRQLKSLLGSQKSLPRGVRREDIKAFESDLESALVSVSNLSEQDYVSITDMYWMKEVRDISYDAQDYLDMVLHYSVGGWLDRCVLSILKPQRRNRPLFERDISHLGSRLKYATERHQDLVRKKAKPNPEDHATPSGIKQSEIEEDDVNTRTKQSKQSEIEEDDVNTRTKQSKQSKMSEIEETENLLTQESEFHDNNLISLLSFDTEQQLKVVPILGTASVGKTTLARRLYNSYGGRFQCRAFLYVSRRPTIETLVASMLSQIKAPQSKGSYDVEILIDNIKQHLRGKSNLLNNRS